MRAWAGLGGALAIGAHACAPPPSSAPASVAPASSAAASASSTSAAIAPAHERAPSPLVTPRAATRDLNGDGIADLAVGAAPDAIYLYWGGPQALPASPSATIHLSTPEGPLEGTLDLVPAGDLDGDGVGDLVVLQHTVRRIIRPFDVDERKPDVVRTRIDVFRGGPRLGEQPPVQSFVPPGSAIGVAAAGDVNGDGRGDVLVRGEQSFYVYHGTKTGLGTAPAAQYLDAPQPGHTLPLSLAGVGDLNHDGYDDVAVGAYVIHAEPGRVYVYLGGAGGLARQPVATIVGPDDPADPSRTASCAPPDESTKGQPWRNDFFGTEVAGAGDLDGDGFDDLLVGANGYGVGVGRAYVYLGEAGGVAVKPAATYDDPQGFCQAAYVSVAAAGDVNRDGFADFLFGAESHADNVAVAELVLGSAEGPARAPRVVSDLGPWNFAPTEGGLQGAGDLDGDGYPDVVIGTYLTAPGKYDMQAAWALAFSGNGSASLVAPKRIALPRGTRAIGGRD